MNDRNPDEILARLIPFASERDDSVGHDPAREALFTEITMTDIETRPTRETRSTAGSDAVPTRRPVWRRPGAALGAAAAATLLVVGGLAAAGERGGSSAQAEVIAAAEALAGRDSGIVDVTIDLRSFTDGEAAEPGTMEVGLAWAGDDRAFLIESDLDDAASEYRRVDGVDYYRTDERWEIIPEGAAPMPDPATIGLGADPGTMVDLVEAASDVRTVSSSDDAVTYSGTVSAAALRSIPVDRLPAGLALISLEQMPDEVTLTVTVADGLLQSVQLDLVGEFPGTASMVNGTIDATITTEFVVDGPVPAIEAPSADLIDDNDVLVPATAEMLEALDLLEAEGALERCTFDKTAGAPGAHLDEVALCLETNFSPEVVEAWWTINAELLESPGGVGEG